MGAAEGQIRAKKIGRETEADEPSGEKETVGADEGALGREEEGPEVARKHTGYGQASAARSLLFVSG
jgi:hypothetical protein